MNTKTLVLIFSLLGTILLSQASAGAATLTVTNTFTSGPGSLTQAIADAQPGDTINFEFPFSGPATIPGNFVIDKSLTIAGPGVRALILSGNQIAGTIFSITGPSGSTVNISGVTLEGISGVAERGVGIYHTGYGTLDLTGVVIRGCETAVVSYSITNIDRSTIHNNGPTEVSFDWWPGAITNFGLMSITNSTVSDNRGGIGAAIGGAGGIYNYSGALTITNSTIACNHGIGAGGIYHYGFDYGTLKIRNSIVAGNTTPPEPDPPPEPPSRGPDIFDYNLGSGISLGNNLIGINRGAPGSFPAGSPNINSDYVGTVAAPLDAMLGPLQDNGGSTDTRAITAASLAFDNGNSCVVDLTCIVFNPVFALTTDQRGTGRLSGANVDIGAFELRVDPDERIEDLIIFIQSYRPRLHFGTENGLVAKLRSALIELEEHDETEAIAFLYDFVREVEAQRGKKLTEAQANELIAAVEVILASLG